MISKIKEIFEYFVAICKDSHSDGFLSPEFFEDRARVKQLMQIARGSDNLEDHFESMQQLYLRAYRLRSHYSNVKESAVEVVEKHELKNDPSVIELLSSLDETICSLDKVLERATGTNREISRELSLRGVLQ